MNLFLLHTNPQLCAEWHCDKHVVKMVLELVQMLYTAHHLCGTKLPLGAYKKIKNHNHPMAIWVRTSEHNYIFTCELALCLAQEYTYRYNRVHSCEKHVKWLSENIPDLILIFNKNPLFYSSLMGKLSPIPLSMPDQYKCTDPIKSYRNYYKSKYFAKWTNRNVPGWFSFFDIKRFFKLK
jgi:hypothetical protein